MLTDAEQAGRHRNDSGRAAWIRYQQSQAMHAIHRQLARVVGTCRMRRGTSWCGQYTTRRVAGNGSVSRCSDVLAQTTGLRRLCRPGPRRPGWAA